MNQNNRRNVLKEIIGFTQDGLVLALVICFFYVFIKYKIWDWILALSCPGIIVLLIVSGISLLVHKRWENESR